VRWLWVLLFLLGCRAPLERVQVEGPAMGTTFRVVLYARDGEAARAAAEAALERVRALELIFSDYSEDSEARRLAARAPVVARVSPELLELTELALEVGARTGGAFDVSVGPLTRLWRRAVRQGTAPDPAQLAAARAAVGLERIAVDRAAGTLELRASGMRLDYGGIAKGYALDAALAELGRRGFERALVDGGGDVAAGAPPPGEAGWLVAIADPSGAPARAVRLAHAALATSGDLARGGEVDGVPRSHLVDPRSGLALMGRPRVASALAPSGALADALASALLLLAPDAWERAVEGLPGVAGRLVEDLGGGSRVWATAEFPRFVSSGLRGD
jgi:thiamine biosynthesis lipoprotein